MSKKVHSPCKYAARISQESHSERDIGTEAINKLKDTPKMRPILLGSLKKFLSLQRGECKTVVIVEGISYVLKSRENCKAQ